MSEIKYPIEIVTSERMKEVIDNPKANTNAGIYICLSRSERDPNELLVVACDNRTHEAWVEDFDAVSEAVEWLLD